MPKFPRLRVIACGRARRLSVNSNIDPGSRSFCIRSSAALVLLSLAYAVVLSIGLITLPSPAHPIQDPWFTLMELLILGIAPAMLVFVVALQLWVPEPRRALARLGALFMALCVGLTCSVHFVILALSREPGFAGEPWASQVFAFRWPSLAYALDILAWDVFFAIAALCVGLSLRGSVLAGAVRWLLLASAALAFVGMLGVPLQDMQVRNLGIVGYAVLFPLAAAIAALRLRAPRPRNAEPD